MKSQIILMSMFVWTSTGAAVELGNSTSSFGFDESSVIRVNSPGPLPLPATVQPLPAAPAAPGAILPAPTTGTGRGCIPARPYKESTPFKVFVDQVNQTMTVHSLDFPEPLVFPISTGGTLKIPDPISKVAPYCAATPEISQRIITAFESSEFSGRKDCTEEDVRGRSTFFPGDVYKSGQFGALMPNAIRIQGGKFIHRCTGDACKTLGQPVSGECIRVPGWRAAPLWAVQAAKQNSLDASAITFKNNRYRRSDDSTYVIPQIDISETLAKQMKKYGAIDVQVGPPPPMRPRGTKAKDFPHPTRGYCDATDIEQAKQDLAEGKTPDGGFFNDVTSFFETIFGPQRSPTPTGSGQRRPARPPMTQSERDRVFNSN